MLFLRNLFPPRASSAAGAATRTHLKATVLDTLTPRGVLLSALAFFFCVFITLIAGGFGPTAASTATYTLFASCASAAACGTLPFSIALEELSHLNQVTWLTARLHRPRYAVGSPRAGQLVNADAPVRFRLAWTLVSATKNGAVIATNSSHLAEVFCPPFAETCSPFTVFAQVITGASNFGVKFTATEPLEAFSGFAGVETNVVFTLSQGYIAEAYTSFEAGFKAFYCVVSACLFIFYVWSITSRRAPGNADAAGGSLHNTQEQLWVAGLGLAVFWFNDPLFLTYLISPSLATAGFSAFCTATFVSLLLFFFLCLTDNARLEAAAGARTWRLRSESRAKGALYWIPKVLLCSILWAIMLSLYIFSRLSQLSDPSFTFVDTFGGAYVAVAMNVVYAIGALYVLYLFVLLILAFRAFKATSPSTKYMLAVSVTTLLCSLVGLFSQAFSATRNTTILFLASMGVPSIYIWSLLLLMRPAPAPVRLWRACECGFDLLVFLFQPSPPPHPSFPFSHRGLRTRRVRSVERTTRRPPQRPSTRPRGTS